MCGQGTGTVCHYTVYSLCVRLYLYTDNNNSMSISSTDQYVYYKRVRDVYTIATGGAYHLSCI